MTRFELKVLTRVQCEVAARNGRIARPLVFTNGVFDILHRGHVTYLDAAAQFGATLVVATNTDASARRLGKGADRPLNSEADRAAVLAALTCVDWVTTFEEDTPWALIEALRPDIIIKGGDYNMDLLPETALVRSWGGQAVAIDFKYACSTTALVTKIRSSLL